MFIFFDLKRFLFKLQRAEGKNEMNVQKGPVQNVKKWNVKNHFFTDEWRNVESVEGTWQLLCAQRKSKEMTGRTERMQERIEGMLG